MAYSHKKSKIRAIKKFKYRMARQQLNQRDKDIKKLKRKLELLATG